ncbi:hypothetical protein FRX31_017218 [Thalictrum thalictroides]|uniref:Uncharacterized protein n=1 Tax=Thalictrum thalictroides TaxID=46969 RepID=A0A7J6W8E2_THATH|nr:hypothetical protein FRX31_017218 [Thalictrum thalictroides]
MKILRSVCGSVLNSEHRTTSTQIDVYFYLVQLKKTSFHPEQKNLRLCKQDIDIHEKVLKAITGKTVVLQTPKGIAQQLHY